MRQIQMPFTFEDRTGQLRGSDYDDIYDRMFVRVAPYPPTANHKISSKVHNNSNGCSLISSYNSYNNNATATTLAIYVMSRRSTRHADMRHLERHPSVVLEFGSPAGLGGISLSSGTVHFLQPPAESVSVPMNTYLRKTALFGGSLSRKFRASDGREYRWQHKTVGEHEWSCLSEENYIIAHYDLRPLNVPAYSVSGNTLTVYEAYSHLYIDIFASLTIMRYIAENAL